MMTERDEHNHAECSTDDPAHGGLGLGPEIDAAVEKSLRQAGNFFDLGFTQDDFGQFKAVGCRVILYPVGGEVEIDIFLPNGNGVGFDVPARAIKCGIRKDGPPRCSDEAFLGVGLRGT
jgi:hypothetical protein